METLKNLSKQLMDMASKEDTINQEIENKEKEEEEKLKGGKDQSKRLDAIVEEVDESKQFDRAKTYATQGFNPLYYSP